MAVSYIDETTEDSNVAAAQSADELLTIKDVNMSFVLVRNEEYINISGRSVGDMNVQVILEYLGGGAPFEHGRCSNIYQGHGRSKS